MNYQQPKGTHDMIGLEARLFDEVTSLMKEMARLYGYNSVHTPMFEATELFTRSVGEGSDIVRKEMYTFLDKGNRSLTLRPEMTAGALRAIINAKLDKTASLPIKVSYLGPSFRYERPQLGRFRQFHQFGIEAIGITSSINDVEAIMLGYHILEALGFSNIEVLINSLGDDASRDNYRQALKDYFKQHIEHMCPDCKNRYQINPLRILDCKVPSDQAIAKGAPNLTDYLSTEADEYYQSIKKYLDQYGIPYVQDDQLVRGLDYYSNIVFEYHLSDSLGKSYGALGAGGHYDHLFAELGGSPLQGVGFAFGLERIIALIQELAIAPDLSQLVDTYVIPVSEQEVAYAFAIASLLRNTGLITEMNYQPKSMKQSIKTALALGARYAIIVGEEEFKMETATVKDLSDQTQASVKVKGLVDYFQKLYDHHDHECHCHEGEDCHCKEQE